MIIIEYSLVYALMRFGLVSIHRHVPGCGGYTHPQPVQRLRHKNLAAQPGRLRQPKGHIQHVVLLVGGLRQPVKHFRVLDDHVAGGAGQRRFAGAL